MPRLRLKFLTGELRSPVFVFAVVLLLIIFAGLFASQVAKNPLRLDEVDYFRSMQNVIDLGVPIYYSGEANIDRNLLLPLSTRQLAGQEFRFYRYKPETGKLKETFIALVEPSSRYIYGLWHPPLYIYLGSIFLRLLPLTPDNSSGLRYLNLIFTVGVFGGMAALARELSRSRWRQIFLMALVLFVSSSLAVRGSLLIDYNGTLGPCVAVWTSVAYLRSEQQRRWSWGLVFLIVLVWFTSLGIAVSLLLGLCAYWLFWGRHQIAAWYPLVSLLLGTALFLPTFLVFCRILDLPFTQPFLHNLSRAGVKWNLDWVVKVVSDTWMYVRLYSEAIGVAIVCVAIAFFVAMILKRNHSASPPRVLLPVLFFVGMLAQASLGANAWGFMKYVLFLLPMLFVYIAYGASSIFKSAQLPWKVLTATTLLVIVLANITSLYDALQASGGTLYTPGQQGIIAAAQRVRAQSDATDILLSEKDIAFYADRKFTEWFGPRFADVNFVHSLIESEDIRWIVVSTQTLASTSEEVKTYLRTTFTENYRADDFVILKRNL